MQWSKKKQIAQAIYEDNLVVAGRQAPKYRRKRIVPRYQFRRPLIILSIVMGVAAVFSAVAITRHHTVVAENASTTALALSKAKSDVTTQAETPLAQPQSMAQAANTPVTKARATEVVAKNIPAPHEIGIDASLDHLFHDGTIPQPQDQIATQALTSKELTSYQGLAHTHTSLARLFGLGVRTIVIDPGHGGRDPGASGPDGTHEKDVALAIALRLRERLKRYDNFKVYMTRDSDVHVALRERVQFANEKHADLFVSIHTNSFPSNNLNFIETYYFGANSDTNVTRLAETENSDSDFVYAEFKEMLQNISDTMKFQESKKLARSVQRTLYTNMHRLNAKAHNHGIKAAPFVVLLGLDAPSILTEVSNLSDKREEQRLKKARYQDKIAKFLEKGIVNYLNKVTSDKNPTTVTTTGGRGNAPEKEKLAKEETH